MLLVHMGIATGLATLAVELYRRVVDQIRRLAPPIEAEPEGLPEGLVAQVYRLGRRAGERDTN